jgi:hypothetical protein
VYQLSSVYVHFFVLSLNMNVLLQQFYALFNAIRRIVTFPEDVVFKCANRLQANF